MSKTQYIRKITVILDSLNKIDYDLSELKVSFKIKKTISKNPNKMNIVIYNLPRSIFSNLAKNDRIILQAGYEDNFGVIFVGNIVKTKTNISSNTESENAGGTEILCHDGGVAYETSFLSTNLKAGQSKKDIIDMCANVMKKDGVTKGYIPDILNEIRYPRGKTIYGPTRDIMTQACGTDNISWNIEDGKLNLIKMNDFLPNQAIEINGDTGLLSCSLLDNSIHVKTLLNPLYRIGGKILINEFNLIKTKGYDILDGVYKILEIEHSGETNGSSEWFSILKCVPINDLVYKKKVNIK